MSLIPFSPGTTTSQDKYGNITGVRANQEISAQMWEDLGGIDQITSTPVEPLGAMWAAQAAAPVATPWIASSRPPEIQLLSYSSQVGPAALGICGLLNLVPGLGAWIGTGCKALSVMALAGSITGFYKSFRVRKYAVYFGRRLLGLMGQEAVNEFMRSTKRAVRTKIRVRRSS